jgi:hypothetical protein
MVPALLHIVEDRPTWLQEGLWLITSQLLVSGNTSERHNWADGSASVGVFMNPWHLPWHYVGVRDLWSTLRT